MKMKWKKFDYNNYKFENGKEYFLLVKNKKFNIGHTYYYHIISKNNTIFMFEREYEFNYNFDEHEILYYCKLPKADVLIRKNKIKNILKCI